MDRLDCACLTSPAGSIVTLAGATRGAVSAVLEDALHAMHLLHPGGHVVVDLHGLEEVTRVELAAVARVVHDATQRGLRITVRGPFPPLRDAC